MKKKWLAGIAGILIIVAAGFAIWQLSKPGNTSATELNKQEVQTLIKNQLGGKITTLKEKKKVFHAKMEKQDHIYEIEVDAETGDIIRLEKVGTKKTEKPPVLSEDEIKEIALANAAGTLSSLSKAQSHGKTVYKAVVKNNKQTTNLTIDAAEGKILSKTNEPVNPVNPPKQISEAEAGEIAVKQVKGEVDDISLHSSKGQTYYLCEVNTADGREATVQVHAITGDVMSVAWDDHGGDDNDDDGSNDDNDDNNDDDGDDG
ncbi:PepSY domain-containing protein [Bacillus sp. EB01]|uniref:PepSY domain-containing protein n=1 Tax=Bacillus sp. EB01 TaxID=1347086 RepID=UPI0006931F29|nr:PepSY domain-containing protein [Bacillus sp. EB01]